MWVKGFHRWMLGVAAQWLGRAQDCANAVAPMLVSRQHGKRKSSFCKILMPKELTPYYIIKRYDIRGKKYLESSEKFYLCDTVYGMQFWEAEIWIMAECTKIWFV